MLPKQSKLLLLFFSKENPLWRQLVPHGSITQRVISAESGVSQSTISNWRKGASANLVLLGHEFNALRTRIERRHRASEIREKLLTAVNGFWHQLTTDSLDVPVYDVAEKLSMSMEQTQRILDEIIYTRFTLFPMLSYNSEKTANSYALKYGGSYTLWARRVDRRGSEAGPVWLKCPLRVRYALRLGSQHVIRCKLNAPRFSIQPGERKYWEYDGFLRTRGNKVFWMFEKREDLGSDFFFAITTEGRIHEADNQEGPRLTMAGTYLTTGQDDTVSIECSDVLIQRLSLPHSEQDNDIRNWMHNRAQILDPRQDATRGEFDRVEQLWRGFVRR
jgi:hypothetical protein